MSRRFHERRCSEPSLEWEELPVLGQNPGRHRYRARFGRMLLVLLAAFWVSVAWLVIGGG